MKQCKTRNQEVSSDLLTKGIRLTLNEFLILEEFSCRAGNRLKMPNLLGFSSNTVDDIFLLNNLHLLIKTQMRKRKKSYRTKFSPTSLIFPKVYIYIYHGDKLNPQRSYRQGFALKGI